MAEQPVVIYTIGHSNMSVEELVQLLQAVGVRVLVDIRSSPYAKYAVQFNREAFQAHPALPAAHIRYMYAGKMLGGRPENDIFYDDEGHVRYDEIANSYTFQHGIEKLLEVARLATTTIMCSEEDPHECHRRLLIARVLDEEGVQVRHLRADGRAQTEEDLLREETAGQLALGFEREVEEKQWRSVRSVSPRKAPPNSLDY